MNSESVLFLAALCAAITLALCLWAMPISQMLALLDVPDERKQHRTVTPLMGGVALQISVVPIAVFIALFFSTPEWSQHFLVWTGATAAMAIIGLADDRHDLSARDRLLLSFLVFGSAAVVDPLFNVRILAFEHPIFFLGLGSGWLAILFTALCCVGLVNAVNMADGKNGLVLGLALGWLSFLGLRAPPELAALCSILFAACFVLLIFNLRGRLFLGDGGAYGLATAIGLIAIATYNVPGAHAGRMISAEELMLLFAVPVLDSMRLTFARVRRGQSPMAADRDHLHHHLQSTFGWPGGLIVYLVLALLPAIILTFFGI
jgi:UDP-GlcNAc:undecaprenyl-phosphate/decaprenyl-phosphate GlcNAc-1-phosphate transferase